MHLSSPRDNFDFVEYKKCSDFSEHFLLSLGEQLSLPLRASEVIFDSEVHGVSEVSPKGEVKGKLNFTCAKHKLHCLQLHFRDSENFTIPCPGATRFSGFSFCSNFYFGANLVQVYLL